MAAFSLSVEYNGKEITSLRDIFNIAMNNIDTDYIYLDILVKDYFGKDVAIKITDIEKDKEYHQKLLEIGNG